MKPLIGIGSFTVYGTVVNITKAGVEVENNGKRKVISFQLIEQSVERMPEIITFATKIYTDRMKTSFGSLAI